LTLPSGCWSPRCWALIRTRFPRTIARGTTTRRPIRIFIVTSKYEQRRSTGARWGLVNSWAHDNSRAAAAIDAKAETIDTRGAFRGGGSPGADAWFRPMDPYDMGGRQRLRRMRFHRKDGGPILFAGLYESWFPQRNQPQLTLTIVTGAANGVIAPIHDECRCCSMSAGPTIG